MPKIKPYKFKITPIFHVLNDDGDPVAEVMLPQWTPPNGEPSIVLGCKNLEEWAREFPIFVEELQKQIDDEEQQKAIDSLPEEGANSNDTPEE